MAAVMGGRGMGKTSLALRIAEELRTERSVAVHLIRRPQSDPAAFLQQLGTRLGATLDPNLPADSVVKVVSTTAPGRVVLLIDEVEALIASEPGREFLDNLRVAYEELGGALGIVIFGGSALRELLIGDVSPFLRTAQWLPLRSLGLDETASLVRSPLSWEVADEIVEVLWELTGGHPFLLQAILERAVTLGAPEVDRLDEAIEEVASERFHATLFDIWWDNLQTRGRDIYRKILRQPRPLRPAEYGRILGGGASAWVEVLETTGVAREEGDLLLPRCSLFRAWLDRHHPREHVGVDDAIPTENALVAWFRSQGAHEFEQQVVSGMAQWARDLVEYPTMALRFGDAQGAQRLLPERHFQLSLVIALRQRELFVEAEALSSTRGRADLKLRWPRDSARRACVEVKIWGHTGYEDVVRQVLGYAVAEDDFACVVMIDRHARSLAEPYRARCLHALELDGLWPAEGAGPASVAHPSLVTLHHRSTAHPIRIYHFLVQLPADDPEA